MAGIHDRSAWLILSVRLPANPSRHRVAAWRELRRIGAISLGGGVWAVPAAPVFAEGVARVAEMVREADGVAISLQAKPSSGTDAEVLAAEFNAARADEWSEFTSECAKFEVEIAKEHRIGKLTLAELDEEEHSLDRLRRWCRDLKSRDIFGVPEGVNADEQLKRCTAVLDVYADEVYRAAHAPLGGASPDA